jgi:copper chaperone CopZ
MTQNLKEKIYYVKGMHCASCEILLEKELLKFEDIKFIDASTNEGIVKIGYMNKEPDIKELNHFFKKYGYTFFEKPFDLKEEEDKTD